MAIQRGTILVIVSARVAKSWNPRLLLAKILFRVSCKLAGPKTINMEVES